MFSIFPYPAGGKTAYHAVPVPEFWRHVSPRSACALGIAVYLACNAALKRVAAAGIPLQTSLGGVNAAAFLRFASGAVPAFAAVLVPGVPRYPRDARGNACSLP
ncbi:hypothetical protein [Treponema endosymbiont of Eucomonympha sp.]|uniref:hypothetical protein n=1 Tax=Treponema endosymbiont of Eucomonympha sp. TaxID=1580831 RepID=UPI0007849D93|nr:hypothetical protein [Treponema endosymbiont of Eucomonympha sp.]